MFNSIGLLHESSESTIKTMPQQIPLTPTSISPLKRKPESLLKKKDHIMPVWFHKLKN